jgi:hypothetical protein
VKKDFAPTQLRELYNALGALSQGEETVLAEWHAENPRRLLERLEHSVKTVSGYPALKEPFHDPRPSREAVGLGEIKSTADFAHQLAEGKPIPVSNEDNLSFRFVAREVFPLRQTEKEGARPERRWLDLLLISDDGYPIAGELKIRGDSLTYFAFVQALMYAAELSSASQLRRLAQHYDTAGFREATQGPVIDIYLIAFEPPTTGDYREPSFKATKKIIEQMVQDERFTSVVRRTAYLEAAVADDRLLFERRFVFPP